MALIFNNLPKLKEKLMPLFGLQCVPEGRVNSEWILSQNSKEDMEHGLSPGAYVIFQRILEPCYSEVECLSARFDLVIIDPGT